MKFKNRSQATKQTGLSYLGNTEINPKIIKSKKVSNTVTYSLMLSPANTSGYNVCSHSTPECRLGCLHNSGRVKVEDYSGKNKIRKARIKRTKLFFEEYEFFMNWLIAEIKAKKDKAHKEGFDFSIRLNTLSDIDWTKQYINDKTLFEIFSDVQFYDYTKNFRMFEMELPENYHLTLSYTGRNKAKCLKILQNGYNVAVIFDTPQFPEKWYGFPVINGDLTDYRPLDNNGVVVGLQFKYSANKEIDKQVKNSCFVVNTINVPETNITTIPV